MGAPLMPTPLMLRHRPPNALCRSATKNEIVGKVGGRRGRGTNAIDKIGLPVSPRPAAFFGFSCFEGFFLEFLRAKKRQGTHPLDPLITSLDVQ